MYAYASRMRKYFRIIKRIFQVLILTLAAMYVILYLCISLPNIQDTLRSKAEDELSKLLEVPLTISRIEFSPFNRIELFHVTIPDLQGDTLLYANKIGVGISLEELILNNRICLNNIQLFGMDANITRETPTGDTNLQFIIDAFQPEQPQEPTAIDLRINSAMIRRSRVSYNVLSEPCMPDSCFDINHISVSDLSTTINIRALKPDSLNVYIKRLSCKEKSGLSIDRLTLQARANTREAHISDFVLQLPNTHIEPQIDATFTNIKKYDDLLDNSHLYVKIARSKVTLSDIAPLVPQLYKFDSPISLACDIEGNLKDFTAHYINIDMANKAIALDMEAAVQNTQNLKELNITQGNIHLYTKNHGPQLIRQNIEVTDTTLLNILTNASAVDFNSNISGSLSNLKTRISLSSGIGDFATNLTLSGDSTLSRLSCNGYVESKGVDFVKILGETSPIGTIAFNADIKGRMRNNKVTQATFDGIIARCDFNQYSYEDIVVKADINKNRYSGKVELLDPNGQINIEGYVQLSPNDTTAALSATCQEIDLAALNLVPKANGNKLSFNLNANLAGSQIDRADGYVHIDNIFYGNKTENFKWKRLNIDTDNTAEQQQISITSDFINGEIAGEYTFKDLAHSLKNIVSQFIPSVIPPTPNSQQEHNPNNNFNWHLTVNPHIKVAQMLNLPVVLTDTARIDGFVGDSLQAMQVNVSIPHMYAGVSQFKEINVNLGNNKNNLQLNAQANILNIEDEATLVEVKGSAENDSIDLSIDWDAHSQPIYNGSVRLGSRLSKDTNDSLSIAIDIHPTNFIINDSIWDIKPASISIKEKMIDVDNLEISRPSQHVYINGMVSSNPQDTLHVDLQEISLDYIFETLNIDFVTFGGDATGRVDIANIYGSSPYICTRKLDIENFSYNDAVFGQLSAFSQLETDEMGILIKGVISNEDKKESFVDGYIFPTRDSLSIAFDVEEAPLAFIRPFLGTILIDVDGTASGHVVLEGTFERIYVYGDAYAHDFSFGVPFIETRYHLSDSIHFTKNEIYFDNVTVYDTYNHTAKGRGSIKHQYFTQTEYNIDIYDANKVLVFDVPRKVGVPYYGTIFGSGNVNVSGNEYNTNIVVNMTPNRNSNFTFVLTNTTSAADYPFLTFSNKREEPIKEEVHISEIDSFVMQNNMLLRKKTANPIQNVLDLSITASITPESEINIVMNEITGDKMQAYGEGVMRLDFNTANNEILMYGNMSVDKGTYDFSLEDIIKRNFKIRQGGSVSFQGNPLEATLDISASYSLQANLADLDASFTNDSEITRTNVPVNAILLIKGPLMKPDVGFDIELPTLSSDMESRMKSIINTEEMMTRQIMYLLAINRFYTTEYSSNQQSYNELGAIAASTLSSSISALMGQISDNWSISPKVRSERGDFTDLEVDLYLSSQLLNNRLLFNGSFGYRDSRYNTTNFIGDFDIEYLLTENGNLRLKGYNHFNDRNHTMRTAITTQGLGLIYKHDFNTWKNFFEFSNIKLFTEEDIEEEEYEEEDVEEYDTTQPVDSVITITPDILE